MRHHTPNPNHKEATMQSGADDPTTADDNAEVRVRSLTAFWTTARSTYPAGGMDHSTTLRLGWAAARMAAVEFGGKADDYRTAGIAQAWRVQAGKGKPGLREAERYAQGGCTLHLADGRGHLDDPPADQTHYWVKDLTQDADSRWRCVSTTYRAAHSKLRLMRSHCIGRRWPGTAPIWQRGRLVAL